MVEPNSLSSLDKKMLTYKEYIRSRHINTVVLASEMIDVLGKEQAYEIIKNAFYKDMVDKVKEELLKVGPVESFKDFVEMEKEENESPEFRKIVSLTYPHESSNELSLHITECLYAEVFKELGAEDLGYLMICHPDHAYAQTCHSKIKLRRSRARDPEIKRKRKIMLGDTSQSTIFRRSSR